MEDNFTLRYNGVTAHTSDAPSIEFRLAGADGDGSPIVLNFAKVSGNVYAVSGTIWTYCSAPLGGGDTSKTVEISKQVAIDGSWPNIAPYLWEYTKQDGTEGHLGILLLTSNLNLRFISATLEPIAGSISIMYPDPWGYKNLAAGPDGAPGVAGVPGVRGEVGPTGPTGEQGLEGYAGLRGEVGAIVRGPLAPPSLAFYGDADTRQIIYRALQYSADHRLYVYGEGYVGGNDDDIVIYETSLEGSKWRIHGTIYVECEYAYGWTSPLRIDFNETIDDYYSHFTIYDLEWRILDDYQIGNMILRWEGGSLAWKKSYPVVWNTFDRLPSGSNNIPTFWMRRQVDKTPVDGNTQSLITGAGVSGAFTGMVDILATPLQLSSAEIAALKAPFQQ